MSPPDTTTSEPTAYQGLVKTPRSVGAHKLPPLSQLTAHHATAPKFVLPDNYVARGLPPAPELRWDERDEPYIEVGVQGCRVTPYRATEGDYEACERISNDPAVAQWSQARPYPYTRADAVEWFCLHMPGQQEAASKLRSDPSASVHPPFMVIRDSEGNYIGDIGLEPIKHDGTVMMGYALDPAFHGRGIGRAAVAAVISWAKDRMGSKPVFRAGAQVINHPSNRLLASLGFVNHGELDDPWPQHTGGGTRRINDWRLSFQ